MNKLDINNLEFHWYTNQDSQQMVKATYSKYPGNFFHEMVPRDEALDLIERKLEKDGKSKKKTVKKKTSKKKIVKDKAS